MKIKIASRKSDLARLQAQTVGQALRDKHPHLEIEYVYSSSAGDLDQDRDLTSFGDKGAFTSDFYKGLVQGDYDLVVHSWKDLPVEDRPDTEIVGTLEREDPRDILLFKKSHLRRYRGNMGADEVVILTSSPRRQHNLSDFFQSYFPFVVENPLFEPIRGNIQTRMKKFMEGPADAIVVAKAALDRLLLAEDDEFAPTRSLLTSYFESLQAMVLPLELNPSAAAQGALAVEIKRNRSELVELFADVKHELHQNCVEKERQVLKSFGGGCHQKIGVTVVPSRQGYVQFQRGLTEQGVVIDKTSFQSSKIRGFKPPVFLEEIFPLEPTQDTFFQRTEAPLSIDELDLIESARTGLFVARVNALPEDHRYNDDQCVWVSGIETWKKLAQLGVWVNGCNEGMGMKEVPNIQHLLSRKVNWVKLTHNLAEPHPHMQTLVTYNLSPKQEIPNLNGKKYFYWMSGSQFNLALKKYPNIKQGFHFCGLGSTYQTIRAQLGSSENLFQFYGYSPWKKWITKNIETSEM